MLKLIIQMILFVVFFCLIGFIYTFDDTREYYQTNSWNTISTSLIIGKLFGHYSIDETLWLINSYLANFPDVVQQVAKIGYSVNGLPIIAVQLAKIYNTSRDNTHAENIPFTFNRLLNASPNNNNFEGNEYSNTDNVPNFFSDQETFANFSKNIELSKRKLEYDFEDLQTNSFTNRPALLITAMHQGSDLMSLSMIIYTLKRILYDYAQGNNDISYLLETRQVWVVPFINADTYSYLSNIQLRDSTNMRQFMKNKRPFSCSGGGIPGVNLRRNYQTPKNITFNRNSACSTYYEGPEPFSEPETQAVLKLISTINFTIAINLLAPTVEYLLPFNYINQPITPLLYNSTQDYYIYQDLANSSLLDPSRFGNTFSLEGGPIYGDVTDFMYNNFGIYALTAELGLNSISLNYLIASLTDRLTILEKFYPFLFYSLYFIGPNFSWDVVYEWIDACKLAAHKDFYNCTQNNFLYSGKVVLKNNGLSSIVTSFRVFIRTTPDIILDYISIQEESQQLYCFSDPLFDPISFKSHGLINNTFMLYELELLNFIKRSSLIIGFIGRYNGDLSLSNSFISFEVDKYKAYNDRNTMQIKLKNIVETVVPKSITQTDNDLETRKASYILLIVYFCFIIVVYIVLGIRWAIKAASQYKFIPLVQTDRHQQLNFKKSMYSFIFLKEYLFVMFKSYCFRFGIKAVPKNF